MRSFYLCLVLSLVGVCALFASAPVFADTILFQDGFETESVVSTGAPGTTTSAFPGAPTIGNGWYSINHSGSANQQNSDVQVTNWGTPGPKTGNNYLRLVRDITSGNSSYNEAEADIGRQTTVGDIVRCEADVYIPIFAGNNIFQFYGFDYGGSVEKDNFNFTVHSDGTIWNVARTAVATGLTATAGMWQHWMVDFHVASGATTTVDLTVGGSTVTGLLTKNAVNSSGYLQRVVFDNGFASTQDYQSDVDNVKVTLNPSSVPEPSSVVLIGTGLLGLLAYAWRKRK